jgi:P-type Cu+ transporter
MALDKALIETPAQTLAGISLAAPQVDRAENSACFHCGLPCPDSTFAKAEKNFCCRGCLIVHDLLAESGLDHFYDLNVYPGVRISQSTRRGQWDYLDEPALQEKLLDFTDGRISRITLQIPAIHCVACVWLLENLFRLHPGVGRSQVNFAKREVAISFDPQRIRLSKMVGLLASIGYEPRLTLSELERTVVDRTRKRQWLQVGVAGFAFGNIMLFSLPGYLGLDSLNGPVFRTIFGYVCLALALPVMIYSASDYWRSALLSFRRRILTLDVPIAVGLAALYAQSAYEIISARGGGYLDSLAGLIFFLLCGRVFQQKTHERIVFDRDYRCFFPLSVIRKEGATEETVSISNLRIGDRVVLRNGELIPADARLIRGEACIDYSFVTGESEPTTKQVGDYLYAGGKQVGGAIELETVKPVSQSYLTSLWDDATFSKNREDNLNTLTNRYSRRFTRLVIGIAVASALAWVFSGQATRGLKAFTSVLIVACPCALALAAPFTLGTAQRLLACLQVFLKNSLILERIAGVDTIVFDKTGTLTAAQGSSMEFYPAPGLTQLTEEETEKVGSFARHSTHPYSTHIAQRFSPVDAIPVASFREEAGAGLSGSVDGAEILLGSPALLERHGLRVAHHVRQAGSRVCLGIAGQFRGTFVIRNTVLKDVDGLLADLGRTHEITLLSGDNEREKERFTSLFGPQAKLHFNQSPVDKLSYIRELQRSGRHVMMVGDGLNDAGALKQSNVGVAVVERVGAFSPASDIIIPAAEIRRLAKIVELSRKAARIVRLSFAISAGYNVVGVAIAAAGILSPLVCAILMPLSSVSVVLFACGMTHYAARNLGLTK